MSLEKALEEIHKQFGKESIMRIGDSGLAVEAIPTGSFLLDEALGVGGYPKGRIIEIYGPESSGKTTLALHALAEAQKQGGNVAFIDAEYSLDLGYASKIGVDVEKLLVSQPDCGEDALSIVDALARSGDIAVIVVDSVAALTPRAELDGEMGQSHMGTQARLMSQAMRKLTQYVSKTNCIVIFINQIRMKIGVMFGSPETTSGGGALKFYSSIRLDIRRKASIKRGEETIGNEVKIKVVKNKVAPPFRVAETCIMFGKGIYREGEILSYFIKNGEIEKAGAWYKFKEEKLHGQDNMIEYIKDNPELFEINKEK